jgi:hypothetical protein
LLDSKTRELPDWTLFWTRRELSFEDQDRRQSQCGRLCDTGCVAFPSSCSGEASTEHTCEVMPCWGAAVIESPARKVLDSERSEKRQGHPVEVCRAEDMKPDASPQTNLLCLSHK